MLILAFLYTDPCSAHDVHARTAIVSTSTVDPLCMHAPLWEQHVVTSQTVLIISDVTCSIAGAMSKCVVVVPPQACVCCVSTRTWWLKTAPILPCPLVFGALDLTHLPNVGPSRMQESPRLTACCSSWSHVRFHAGDHHDSCRRRLCHRCVSRWYDSYTRP